MSSTLEYNNEIFPNCPNYNQDLEEFDNHSFNISIKSDPIDSLEDGFNVKKRDDIFHNLFPGKDDNFVCNSNNSTKETKKNEIFKFEKVKREKNNNILTRKRGRKRKNDISERNHNKNSEDNIIRKIKVNMFKYARYIINENLEKDKIEKQPYNKISDLKRDDNIKMFNQNLKEIFFEKELSKKYRNEKYKNYNRNLIDKIYKGKIKQERVKKILDLTFLDLLEICKGNEEKINQLKQEKIRGYKPFIEFLFKEKKKKEVSSYYIEKVKNMINNYEKWFENKKGRK